MTDILLKVVKAKHKGAHKLELVFNNGFSGTVDLKDSLHGPVFKSLQDLDNFKNFHLNRWTVEWECGADFAPEYLYNLALKQEQELKEA